MNQLTALVTAARNYYRGHQGEVGTVLVDGREQMYVKSGEEGGPWGGTQRGGAARGKGESYTSGQAHEGNIASHVEGHVANIMREQGISQATLVMGVDQCQICATNLPTVLPRGATLEVVHVSDSGEVNTNTYRSNR